MWILPKQLHTSPYVPDTAALISDSDEFSQLCAQSLTQRGKDSAARTWSAKLKRDSWMQLLFGRTLKPSHGPSFATAWASCLGATHASRSQPLASASAPKTQDTSGRTYQPELLQCDQQYVSLKMSRDISRWGCPTLSKTWQEWVTERRGAYSARLKLARRIKESASSSWPSPNAQVSQDGESPETWLKRKEAMKAKGYNGNGCGTPLTIAVQLHGQADPASSNTSGSRQGLWGTPRATEAKLGRRYTPGMTGKDLTKDVMQWATPQAHDAQGPKTLEQIAAMRAKGHGVKNLNEMVSWATPCSRDHHPNGQADGSKTDLGNQVTKQWATPNARDPKGAQGRMAKIGQVSDLPSQTEVAPTGQWNRANGKLNPRWVETLMGLPIGWTMPSCTSPQTIALTSCDSSAMELCQPPQSEPLELFFQS
jgi:hypothetical protein